MRKYKQCWYCEQIQTESEFYPTGNKNKCKECVRFIDIFF